MADKKVPPKAPPKAAKKPVQKPIVKADPTGIKRREAKYGL